MDGGIAAVIAGGVGIVGALGGALIGGRFAVNAASLSGQSAHELSRLEARRQAYSALGTAAFRFSRKVAGIRHIVSERLSNPDADYVPVPVGEHEELEERLDEVAHAAMVVQLQGPHELVDMAWDVYVYCQRAERALAEYAVTTRFGAAETEAALEDSVDAVSRARGIFLSNGRAYLAAEPVPVQGEPYRRGA